MKLSENCWKIIRNAKNGGKKIYNKLMTIVKNQKLLLGSYCQLFPIIIISLWKRKENQDTIENKDNCFKFRKIRENPGKFMVINKKFYKTSKKIAENKRKIEENCKELQEI